MLNNTKQNAPSLFKLVAVPVFPYIVVIALLGVLLEYLFPAQERWIRLAAKLLPWCAGAFWVGWTWNAPAWTRYTRRLAQVVMYSALALQWQDISWKPDVSLVALLTARTASLGALILVIFALGRWAKRRQNGANAD